MKIPFLQKSLVLAICALLSMGGAYADSTITMDGSTGVAGQISGNPIPDTTGKIYNINGDGGANAHGKVNGTNLFFSFSNFGINSGDIAQFQCASGKCGVDSTSTEQTNITNVISRVTGTDISNINGTLRSTIGTANFWFFNPNGVAFGADAKVDVPAAFHIGAASQLIGDDGKEMWNADVNNSTLSVATPDSFGFGGSTGNITISGTKIELGNGSHQVAAAGNVIITDNALIKPTTTSTGTLQINAQGNITVDTPTKADKPSELEANLTAVQSLANSGTITGNATAGTTLTNNGAITGNAEATAGTLTNTNQINGNAIAKGNAIVTPRLVNSGTITGNATATLGALTNNFGGRIDKAAIAGTDLTNSGAMNGGAEAKAGTLTNNNLIIGKAKGAALENNGGNIQGDAEASTYINNNVSITGNAKAGTYINNNSGGLIGNGATAGTDLTNTGAINGNTTATSGALTNSGIITGDAEATAGTLTNTNQINGNAIAKGNAIVTPRLVNSGTITGNATATLGALTNNSGGTIGNGATAGTDLTNDGTITGNAEATAGTLINTNQINGNAIARGDAIVSPRLINSGTITGNAAATLGALTNNSDGLIGNGATAGTDLTNSGTINGGIVQAVNDIKNSGSKAQINLNNQGKVSAQNIEINGGGKITINNTGENTISAGNNLTLGGSLGTGTISANNSGNTTISAKKLTLGDLGDLGGLKRGTVEKTGTGKLTVDVQAGGITVNAGSKVEGNSSDVINTTGDLNNSGTLTANTVQASGEFLNNAGAVINGNVIAEHTNPSGTTVIDFSSKFSNSGQINGSVAANVTNNGTITGNAKATTTGISTKGVTGTISASLTNYGKIGGMATADTDITNNTGGTIGTNATAGKSLDNKGTITGNAIAQGNAIDTPRLVNSGTITGNAAATLGALTNNSGGLIGNGATAGTDLTNTGTINGNTTATSGALTNNGIITGDAEATAGTLTNTKQINGNAIAKGNANVDNSGTITGDATATLGALSNRGTGIIIGNASAKTDLTNEKSGKIGTNGAGNKATAGSSLNNSGTIFGDAIADTTLTNDGTGAITGTATANGDATVTPRLDNSGTITGDATATFGALTNRSTGIITGNASAKTNLTNEKSGNIGTSGAGNKASAGTTLNNGGTITGDATAVTLLDNNGGTIGKDATVSNGSLVNRALSTIKGKATTKTFIDNTGTIEGDAEAATVLTNNAGGTIGTNATNKASAGTTLNNSGTITGDATAVTLLDNNGGTIGKDATVSNGSLVNRALSTIKGKATTKTFIDNTGTIEGDAEAATVLTNNAGGTIGTNATNKASAGTTLNNSGKITGDATAATLLDNNGGTIGKDATVSNGSLVNRALSTIKGKATTKTFIDNTGTIEGDAEAGTDITNNTDGTIGNGATASNDIINYGVISGTTIQAGRDITNTGSKALINLDQVLGTVSAARDLLVDDGGKIIASNTSNSSDTLISAGSILNGNTPIVSTTGGNLKVAKGGVIEKSAGSGAFTVEAKQFNGNGGKLTVTGGSSHISTTKNHDGIAKVAADTELLVEKEGAINLANTGDANVLAGTTLAVGTAGGKGTINATNGDNFNVLAGTDLTVQGADSKITADNGNLTTSVVATIGAGRILTGKSTSGGNLLVTNGGTIEKPTGKGDFKVEANRGNSSPGNVTVTGANSKISTASTQNGAANVAAEAALLVENGGLIDFANVGVASVIAGTTLDVGKATDKGTITASNGGNFNVLAGSDLTVQGAGSKITADNGNLTTPVVATIGAGRILTGKSTSGGNLQVANGGVIEKTTGKSDFKVEANLVNANTGNITVTGTNNLTTFATDQNSQIRTKLAHTGTAIVAADPLAVLLVENGGFIDLANTGTADVTGGTVTVDTTGAINFANTGEANVLAGTKLDVDNKGTIKSTNGGNFNVLAGSDLTVQGADSKITAINTGANAATVIAGRTLDAANTLQPTTTGGNLLVASGGLIEKTAGGGVFSVAAKQGTVTTTTGKLTVTGANSKINTAATHTGTAIVAADTGLLVENNGAIDLANTGTADVTGGTVTVDTTGAINFANTGEANVLAGTTLDVDNKGTIKSTNGGNFNVLAGSDLTVQGADSKITAINTGANAATVIAGRTLDAANTLQPTTTGGNLLVASGGLIEKTAGGGAFSVAAKRGTVTTTTGKLTVTGEGSQINTTLDHKGIATVAADNVLLVEQKGAINFANTGKAEVISNTLSVDNATINVANQNDAAITAGTLLSVSNAGKITAANNGLFTVLAGSDLTVTGTNSKIAANNLAAKGSIISAGSILNNNGSTSASTTGGNLTVAAGGGVEKTSESGALTVAAKQLDGNGGKITVTGVGSQINTTLDHKGIAIVVADTGLLVEQQGAIHLANTGEADVIGNTISVDNAAISISNQGDAAITAGTLLGLSNGGTITAANNGLFTVLAGTDLTVTGAASKITANNLASNGSIISAGSILNNNTPVVSTSGGGLTVSNGGGIEKTSGSGAFSVEAKGIIDAGGKLVAGNLTVTGSNAKIETTESYKGIAKVTADAVLLVDQGGNINLANDNNAEIFAGDTLRVDNTGKISTSNTGLASIIAANGITVGSAGSGVIEKTAGKSDFVIKTQTGSLKASNTGSRISDSSSDAGNMTVEAESLAVTNNAVIEKTGTGTGQLAVRINPNGIVIGSGAKIAATQNSKSNVIDTSGSIDNRGTLTVDTIHAAGIINNFAEGDITGSVTSDLQFINEGTLTGNVNTASSTGTDINNSGTINGAVNALADLNNKGKITGKVNAGNNVSNSGAITGIIEAEQNIDNLSGGTITGKVTAKNAAVINNGTIDGEINAGSDVLNFALISSDSIQAAQDIKTIGSAAQTDLNKEGAALLSAGRDVLVDQGGKITASNTGDTTISAAGTLDVIDNGSIQLANTGTASVTAGGKFTISNAGSIRAANTGAFYALAGDTLSIQTGGKLIADNSDVSTATVSAGTVSDSSGQLLASNTGGNLLVQTGGAIEKNTGSGDLTLAARRADSDGGQLVVEGSGSKISVAHLGSLIIYPDALVPRKFIGNNNQFSDVNNKEQYAFRVSDGGVINKNNLGDMNVTAQTVFLGGLTAIAGTTTGTLEFISVIKEELNNEARLPRYFKMQDSTITNFGPVSISEYFLNLDPSGIKSNTSITLNVFNSADIAFPKVLIGRGSSASALQSGKSFLDAPSNAKILINNRISLNPEDNISTLTRNILASAFVSNVLIPPMPKNPCDKRSQSTLNSKGAVASYIPEISSQVPYSILATTTGASSSLSALPASPLALAILDESDECQ